MEIGFLMLADHAESVNGKLYMVGGGWNVLRLPELPHEWGFHIALGLDVGWSETNQPHNLSVVIHDPDGVELGEGLTADFETGRLPSFAGDLLLGAPQDSVEELRDRPETVVEGGADVRDDWPSGS